MPTDSKSESEISLISWLPFLRALQQKTSSTAIFLLKRAQKVTPVLRWTVWTTTTSVLSLFRASFAQK
jgi:hypothetical protein